MNFKMKSTLCSNNVSVKGTFTRLRAKLKKLGITDSEVYALIDEGRGTLKVMKRQGQKLENRCSLYRTHIEACGFKRISKKKG